jgi:hypothetical protein
VTVRRGLAWLWEHRRPVVLTFELLWIVVFLLEAASRDSGPGIAPFVYVNF